MPAKSGDQGDQRRHGVDLSFQRGIESQFGIPGHVQRPNDRARMSAVTRPKAWTLPVSMFWKTISAGLNR